MNVTTETTTNQRTSIFENKEQYQSFRAKWKQLYSDGFHKPVRHEYGCGNLVRNAEGRWEYDSKAFYMESPLTVWHHLVFNLAIGRNPPIKAFGDRDTGKRKWVRPSLYWNVLYSKKDFSVFGDTLTTEQKIELQKRVDDYLNTL